MRQPNRPDDPRTTRRIRRAMARDVLVPATLGLSADDLMADLRPGVPILADRAAQR